MSLQEISELLDRYVAWVRDKTMLREVGGNWIEITTPYLDRHNDYLQLYVKREGNRYALTDDGYTLDDLEQSGCRLDTPKRNQLLKMTLAGFGVSITESRLETIASKENFSAKKHDLVQAMLAVNDLFFLAAPVVANLFFEDVVRWLDEKNIRYTPRAKFTGKSGYDHNFDFVIPKSRIYPERLVQAMSRPSRESAESLAFKWTDTREVRFEDAKAYALINDSSGSVPPGVVEAIENYDIVPLLWSERENRVTELAE